MERRRRRQRPFQRGRPRSPRIVGGLLLGTLGWPWVFWINVPFGLIAFVAGWLVLPITAQQNRNQTFDWRGALMLAPALTFAVLALSITARALAGSRKTS